MTCACMKFDSFNRVSKAMSELSKGMVAKEALEIKG